MPTYKDILAPWIEIPITKRKRTQLPVADPLLPLFALFSDHFGNQILLTEPFPIQS